MVIVQVCVGSSCHLKGSPEIVELFQKAVEDYHLEDEYQYPIYSCPKCGKHINDGDSYCRHCGQRLEWKDDE